MTQPNRESHESTGSQEIIDDALRLVDALQRKLIIAGVRRGVSGTTSAPPQKGDVWEEAVQREDPDTHQPPMERLAGIVRSKGPEVAGHLGKAGMALFGALGETWGVVEKELEKQRDTGQGGQRSGGQDGGTSSPERDSG